MTEDSRGIPERDGAYRVGIDFNPSGNPAVDGVKAQVATLIDKVLAEGRDARTSAIAATQLEQAAMWAVKALTK